MREQGIVIDTEASRASDDGANQGVLRMDQEEGITAEEQARRRLRSKQPARRSLTDDEAVSKRLKGEARIAAIKQEILNTATEMPDLDKAHKFYASIRTLRSPESIHASRMVEINKWRERGVPSGSRLHTSFSFLFVTAVHEASHVVSPMSFIFLEDSEHTSSISHAMEDEHDSTDMVSRAPVQCLLALDPRNLCNILALSLSR